MVNLTWRDVQAPDFRTSLEGIKTFTGLMDNAFTGLDRGLNTYDQSISDRVNRDFAIRVAQMQDADAASKALVDGSIFGSDADRRRLSAASVTAASNRPTELLKQAATGVDLDARRLALSDSQYTSGRTRSENALMDTARNDFNAWVSARDNGQDGVITSAMRAVDPSKFADFTKIGSDLQTSDLGRDQTRQTMGQSATRFGWEQLDRQTQDEGFSLLESVRSVSSTPGEALAAIEASKGSPRAKAFARGQLTGDFGNLYTATVGTSGGTGGGSFSMDAPQTAVASVLSGSGLNNNVIAGFLGNFHAEGGYGGAQGDGGSAGGIAQWRNERRANFQKVIGVDPTKATPEQQAKFVVWELNNPKAAGMTVAQRDAILNAGSPEQAAALIDQHFERSDGRSRDARIAAARSASAGLNRTSAAGRLETAVRGMGNRAIDNGNADSLIGSINDTRNKKTVIDTMRSGTFKGVPGSALDSMIENVVQRSRVRTPDGRTTQMSYGQAARILENNLGYDNDGWIGGLQRFAGAGGTPNLANGMRVNDDAVSQAIDQFRNGGMTSNVNAQSDLAASAAASLAQEQRVAAAQAEVDRLQAIRLTRPQVFNANIGAAMARLQSAQGQAASAISNQARDPARRIVTSPTPAPRNNQVIEVKRDATPAPEGRKSFWESLTTEPWFSLERNK